jgi:Cu(I)/Ag(I) efflux system membrane fusion protein
MNKRTILIALISVVVAAVAYIVFKPAPQHQQQNDTQPITAGTTTGFQQATTAALAGYYQLKDAFVKSDTTAVNAAATRLLPLVDSMAVDGIAADTALLQMAVEYKKTIATETRNILTVSDIEQKRRSFQPLSDALFDLLRTTRYKGSKVYQQYCPMAFDNSGAAWLSNSPDVVNPYFGDAMLHCGELRDSVRQ